MFDVAVIGGGIVGLSTAYQLIRDRKDLKVCVIEKESGVALHQSSHNSGVIHSGIYYQPGSKRAKLCARGYQQLLSFCDRHQIPYEICGKLIVATCAAEVPILKSILEKGIANGLQGLSLIDRQEANTIEPHIQCEKAIRVPQAGIIDFALVARKYAELFLQAGGTIRLATKVQQIIERTSEVEIKTSADPISARRFITCGGLYADHLAKSSKHGLNVQILPFRGEFFRLKTDRQHLVNHLIYPVPDPNFPFLGVHFTRVIDGGIEAGPNAVLAFRREGYHFSDLDLGELIETLRFRGFRKLAQKYWRTGLKEMRRSYSKAHFVKALQKLIPEINRDDVVRGRSGVRAMACHRSGQLADDFLILQTKKGIHVVNAPSPAATASLAIGEEIVKRLERMSK